MSQRHALTAGIDLGDRYSHICLLDSENGEVIEESRIPTNTKAFKRRFAGIAPMRIAIETGTHSPWVSRLLEECGHEVLVANARKVRLIYGERHKNDKIDAEKLARLARVDPKLLSPIKHRGESSQAHLALLRRRLRPQASRRKDRRARRQERQEEGGGSGGQKALGAVAPFMGYGGGLQAALQCQPP